MECAAPLATAGTRLIRRLAALLLLLQTPVLLAEAAPEDAVKAVLAEQERAWNQRDLEAFVRTYSREALFVGKEVTRGSDAVLERYRRIYPTRGRMGALKFTNIEVQMLGQDFASVLGRFHLERAAETVGPAAGIFTLLLKRSGKTWKIILDHTS